MTNRDTGRQWSVGTRQGGFTIMELLTVIVIIVLLIAMAVPAFNAITGSRSVEAARNQVSAMLSLARIKAINDSSDEAKDYGVLFFYNPATERTMMGLVVRSDVTADDPDPLDNYKSWEPNISYSVGDRVIFITEDRDEGIVAMGGPPAVYKPLVKKYRRSPIGPGSTNPPPLSGPDAQGFFRNTWWDEVTEGNLELLADTDIQTLPTGIGVQLVHDRKGVLNADRYLRTGVILFDRLGRLDSVKYAMDPTSNLGKALNLTSPVPPAKQRLYAQFGVAIYDLQKFRSQNGVSDGDWVCQFPGVPAPASWNDELGEETWLDNNAVVLMVNRMTGSLVKGE